MKAQLEDGYTRIANELLDAISGADISRNETKVVLAIIRLSYGWNQKDTGNRAGISNLLALTGIKSSSGKYIYLALKSLVEKRVIFKEKNGDNTNRYSINTAISDWQVDLPAGEVEYVPVYSSPTIENDPAEGSKNQTSLQIGTFQKLEGSKNQTSAGSKNQTSAGSKTWNPKHPADADQQQAGEVAKDNLKDNIKDSSRANRFSVNYQAALQALGLPPTAILSPRDHEVLHALLAADCSYEDIEKARIKRNKNRLEWIQDTVCEMRDQRRSGAMQEQELIAEMKRLYGSCY
jgi:phage replication O-like protein O